MGSRRRRGKSEKPEQGTVCVTRHFKQRRNHRSVVHRMKNEDQRADHNRNQEVHFLAALDGVGVTLVFRHAQKVHTNRCGQGCQGRVGAGQCCGHQPQQKENGKRPTHAAFEGDRGKEQVCTFKRQCPWLKCA